VKHVVKIARAAGKSLVYFPETGLSTTPHHPLKNSSQGSWCFPKNLVPQSDEVDSTVTGGLEQSFSDGAAIFTPSRPTMQVQSESHFVYNFLLETPQNKALLVNNTECAAWGHGLEDDSVIKHEFFGDEMKILDALEECATEVGDSEGSPILLLPVGGFFGSPTDLLESVKRHSESQVLSLSSATTSDNALPDFECDFADASAIPVF
jgi:hypothetical protein